MNEADSDWLPAGARSHLGGSGSDLDRISSDRNDPGFSAMISRLQFLVTNLGYATGLQFNVISATAASVPEPSTLCLATIAGLGMFDYGWSRRRLATV